MFHPPLFLLPLPPSLIESNVEVLRELVEIVLGIVIDVVHVAGITWRCHRWIIECQVEWQVLMGSNCVS
jgi:hypothetical protein